MKYNIVDVRQLLVKAWGKVALPEDAEYISEAVLRASLSKDSRMNPLRESNHDLAVCLEFPQKHDIVVDCGATCVLDFAGTSPFGQMASIHQMLSERAKKYGIASVAMRNTAGVHQLSTWVEPLSRKGDILSLFAWNGGSYTVAPFGTMEPFLGTNPIAFAIPTSDDPIVCDMATSEVPFLSLMRALQSGKDLDRIAGLDEKGKQTNKAKEIYDPEVDGPVRLLPMGLGYKGAAVMLLIEIVTGALIGAKMGREANDQKFTPSEFGGWLVAIDISSFTSLDDFRARVSKLCAQIRGANRAHGVEEILLPGDRALASYRKHLLSGTMDINEDDYVALRKFAD